MVIRVYKTYNYHELITNDHQLILFVDYIYVSLKKGELKIEFDTHDNLTLMTLFGYTKRTKKFLRREKFCSSADEQDFARGMPQKAPERPPLVLFLVFTIICSFFKSSITHIFVLLTSAIFCWKSSAISSFLTLW